jgi:hypothetical protein
MNQEELMLRIVDALDSAAAELERPRAATPQRAFTNG